MKKRLACLLSAAMALSLVACAGDAGESSVSVSTGEPSVSVSVPAVDNETMSEVFEDIAFEEVVVVDNNECAVKITDIEPDNSWGYTLKANLENKSPDKTYMFSVTGAAINGVQCDPYFASEVAPGKKANEKITFSDSSLEENGIVNYTDIELFFRVYDSNDWSADEVAEVSIHVYPYGQDKAETFVREPQTNDIVLVDNEFVCAIVTGFEEENTWGYGVNLYLQNKTDKEVMFSLDEASVNGYMADPFFATSVLAGKNAFTTITWSDTTLEENGITSIEEIEFLFKAYDAKDWTADKFVSEVMTLNP